MGLPRGRPSWKPDSSPSTSMFETGWPSTLVSPRGALRTVSCPEAPSGFTVWTWPTESSIGAYATTPASSFMSAQTHGI